jgi:hypothetical protein
MVADRMGQANPLTRFAYRGLLRLADRVSGGGKDLYFQDGAFWTLSENGEWEEQISSSEGVVSTRNPLFILAPLSKSETMLPASQNGMTVRGSASSCYQVILEADQFETRAWDQITQARLTEARNGESSALQAFVWIDGDGRICRVSYESSLDEEGKTVLWSGTEFWDFGTAIDQAAPRPGSATQKQ